MYSKAWKRRQRESQLAFAREEAEREGLMSTGKEASFFKMMGIGEERWLDSTGKRRIWAAPAHLVRMNRYFKKHGLSSKLRMKTLRNYIEGKEPPASALDVIAGYTEEQLSQR